MQKRKRWQFFLILTVIALTIYNILPTVFYYTKPLNKPIENKRSQKIATRIMDRINGMEKESVDWVNSYCSMLGIKPANVSIDQDSPQYLHVDCKTTEDAQKLKTTLPYAGSLINFIPSQLTLAGDVDMHPKKITLQRQIPIHFDKSKISEYFDFSSKKATSEDTASIYHDLVFDRTSHLAKAIVSESESATYAQAILHNKNPTQVKELVFSLAQEINDFISIFGESSNVVHRYFNSFSDSSLNDNSSFQKFIQTIDSTRDQLKMEKKAINEAKNDSEKEQNIKLLEDRETLLIKTKKLLESHSNQIMATKKGWNVSDILSSFQASKDTSKIQSLEINEKNPFIDKLLIDWNNDKIYLKLHDDILKFKNENHENKEKFEQLLINEIARLNRLTNENISVQGSEYHISLNELTGSESFLLLKLDSVANSLAKQIKNTIHQQWSPSHPELSDKNFPIYDWQTYTKLPVEEKAICLVVYSPVVDSTSLKGFKTNSIYVLAKGLNRILQKYQYQKSSSDAEIFFQDFKKLQNLLQKEGFHGFPAAAIPQFAELEGDFIFENNDYFQPLLQATRENFSVYGSHKYAVLEFTNVEQRLRKDNQIDTQRHEELIKWNDDYYSAQVSMDSHEKFKTAPPTKNVFWNNMKLSTVKYFRGDERKILHWGLDLSGGKTVQIELRDQNNHLVTNEADLKQGMNELYNRVNKMGVSEVNIRALNNNIVLDFPGSQGLSAAELVKASSMFFHIVNEKFSLRNPALSDHVNRFLQEIWNEALVTNRKDIDSINQIAHKHLYGDLANTKVVKPRTESAKVLYENGLRLASSETNCSYDVDETFSKLTIFRGDDSSQWHGQTHPLLVTFNNYTLEGSNLENIDSQYDPSKGNSLKFNVKSSTTLSNGKKIHPGDLLYNWTSRFAKDSVINTPYEKYSQGGGWRMAVILNNAVITFPSLEAKDIRTQASITGNFTQRDVQQLVSDLKAGSLTYTPRILSEKNVSPELGHQERLKGIIATFVALILVIIAMTAYYRFAGIVASVAVLFNLLIMWATLQNLQATLSLAGIAGIILTVGMAVDANVLVFERIKEEFAISHRLSAAIQTGYGKAYSAIVDSNVTTIIAALILLNFDAGPIKGFAITLIIGIVSSMFSALFMTRYFFSRWVDNTKSKMLNMSDWVKSTNFDFLKKSKLVISCSLILMVIGFIAIFHQGKSIFGMDFTGGFSLTLEVAETKDIDYRQAVEKALINQNLSVHDFQIQQLNPSNNLRLLLGTNMEGKGKPYFSLPLAFDYKDIKYSYENNPRIVWIVNALQKEGINITPHSLNQLEKNWTVMSGQMSESMRNNAGFGLMLALIAILIYITFRFEFKYAISAMVCLIHDVVLSIASVAILHFLKIPVQIDLHTIAALMTIIGYSLNDTIIIFDRIREDRKLMRRRPFEEVVNHALNITLSRTTITSATTLFVLLALVCLGGSTVFSFALVMTIGVIFGTFSSLFVASPLMLMIHKFQQKKYSEKETT